jgi:16S rRNA (cytosine967-C5)-methyltransferase
MPAPGKKKLPVRAIAAQVLLQVSGRGQSLTRALSSGQQQLANAADSALLQEMCYGSLRWFYRLDVITSMLLNKPLKERDQDIFCLLLIGLYQLEFMHIPAHAVVKETVDAVLALRKHWAKGLVNALLREYQRNADQLRDDWQQDQEARYAHPAWIIARLERDWPQYYQQILDANNQRPPMVLRVNQQQTTTAQYRQQLAEQGIQASLSAFVDSALILEQAVNVHELPGFTQGLVSVQDSAAQLAAGLMQLQSGMRVLDACCAPGGKTLHMLQACPQLQQLVALDIDADRIGQVQENLDRAGASAELLVGDAATPESWWDGRPFERILVDAPCSGSGVIRRHPDIKLLRSSADIEHLVSRQADILAALWPLLAPGGMLVYSTCSVIRQENEQQINAFLGHHDSAREQRIDAEWGFQCTPGRQILPGIQGMDGFYYACLEKIK